MVLWLSIGGASAEAPLQFSPSSPGGGFKAPVQVRDGGVLAVQTVGAALKCFRSTDLGKTWREYATVAATDTPHTDIGDGHITILANGDLLYSYRQNLLHGRATSDKLFSIKVAISQDSGRTWRHHSTVAAAKATDFGLWSTFLLEKRDGTLQCYYDDERTPSLNGLARHQWITMKTWNPAKGAWENPTTVSRAAGEKLSRDGMCSVIEVSPERLVCVCEGVQEYPPHRGCLWIVESTDGGRTWSLPHRKLWEPKNPDFNALAPWVVRFADGALVAVFTTDENRDKPTEAATAVLFQDLKYLVSRDNGATWTGPWMIDNDYPIYFPGACIVRDDAGSEGLLVQYISSKHGQRCRLGRWAK